MINAKVRGSSSSQKAMHMYTTQLKEECLASAKLLDELRRENPRKLDDKLTLANIQQKIADKITAQRLLRELKKDLDRIFTVAEDH